jgi:hypothetical protein
MDEPAGLGDTPRGLEGSELRSQDVDDAVARRPSFVIGDLTTPDVARM